MVDTNKFIIGFLWITLMLSGVVYIALDGSDVKLRIDNDKSTFYTFEDSRWKVSGREYNKLFDGTKRMYRDLSSIEIITKQNGTKFTVERSTSYKRGPVIIDIYKFDGSIEDIKLFPISHTVKIINGSGYFYRYEVKDLVYDGERRKLDGETSMSFGRNMKVELEPDYRWAWIYGNGVLRAQYDIKSDYEEFNVRLFDPPISYTIEGNSVFINTSKVYLNISPHTMLDDGWINIQLMSKVFSGDIDIVFGFNTSVTVPSNLQLYKNVTNGSNISMQWIKYNNVDVKNIDYDGKNRWYVIKNVNINQDKLYNAKFYLDVAGSGKYDVAIKLSSDTIAEAIANNRFLFIDPWWNESDYVSTQNKVSNHWSILDNGTGNARIRTIFIHQNDLLEHWSFENSGNGNLRRYDGTVSGATFQSSCKINGCYNFDGVNDEILISNPGNILSSSGSIEFWMNGTTGAPLTRGQSGTNYWAFYKSGSTIKFEVRGTFGNDNLLSSSNPFDSSWHHVVFVKNGTNGSFYIDGSYDNSATIDATYTEGSTNVEFGILDTVIDFNGQIDEARFYNKVLIASEISELYNSDSGRLYDEVRLQLDYPFSNNLLMFLEFSNNTIDSMYNASGINNGATYTSDGKIGGAYDFDGTNDYMDTNLVFDFEVSTTSFWFYADNDIGTRIEHPMSCYDTPAVGDDRWFLQPHTDAGGSIFFLADRNNVNQINVDLGISNFNNGAWNHFAVTSNGSNLSFYVNEVNILNSGGVMPNITSTGQCIIGALARTAIDLRFEGLMDEVQIFNKALTSTEISILYNAGAGLVYNTSANMFYSIINNTGTNINWISPTLNLSKNGGEGYFRVSTDNRTTQTNWLTDVNNSENITVTEGQWVSFDINLSGNATASPFITNLGMLSGFAEAAVAANITLLLEGFNRSINVELESVINVSANITDDTICIDIDHPQGGINVSCAENETSYIFNLTYFRTTTFNDSTTSKNIIYKQKETNNPSNIVQTNFEPTQNATFIFDNDPTTYAAAIDGGGFANVSFNLSKALYAQDTRLQYNGSEGVVTYTVTDACREFYDDKIALRTDMLLNCGVNAYAITYCQTGADTWSYAGTMFTVYGDDDCSANVSDIRLIEDYASFDVDAHQYDEVINMTLNLTGIADSGVFPGEVEIYVNNTLEIIIGPVFNSTKLVLGEFNDSDISKEVNFTVNDFNNIGYFRIPKGANVTGAIMNITGSESFFDNIIFNSLFNTATNPSFIYGLTTDNNYMYIMDATGDIYNYSMSGTYQLTSVNVDCDPSVSFNNFGLDNNGTHYVTIAEDVIGSNEVLCILDFDGTQVSNFSLHTNNANPRGVAFDSTHYFVVDNQDDGIYTYNMTGDNVGFIVLTNNQSFPFDIKNLDFSYDNQFWYAMSNDEVCRFTPIITGAQESDFCWNTSIYDSSSALTVNNSNLWFSNTSNNVIVNDIHQYVTDGWMEIGIIDGVKEWNQTGIFNKEITTDDFGSAMNDYLDGCSDDRFGFCYIPVSAFSETFGVLTFSNISINYTYNINPVVISATNVENYISAQDGYTTIPINIKYNTVGNITVDDIKYDYAGGNITFEITAHTPDYSTNTSHNTTYYFSDWTYSLPPNILGMAWYPSFPIAKNVTPFGQTTLIPFLNITPTNYGGNFNFSVHLNESEVNSCVNLTISNTTTKSANNISINTWETTNTDVSLENNFGLWLWADYSCSYSTWKLWQPSISFRACYVGADVCSEAII